ncbi:MAG: divalent metal cation transporter, partial [Alphaproteobacteria bacterium]
MNDHTAAIDRLMGWRRDRGEASLSDVHRSIPVNNASMWRRAMAFVGPGY